MNHDDDHPNNVPPVIAATSAIQTTMRSTDGRFRLGRTTVVAPVVGAGMITVRSLSSGRGGTLISRAQLAEALPRL